MRRWTEAAYRKYFLPNPREYDHSEPYFRVVSMASALLKRCGLKYDASKIGAGPEVPFEFHEQFIHGVLQGPGGTCATLPVVYAAIGRRLGYPIKLACTKRHLFCRWDDPSTGVQFNIEPACKTFDVVPDDHYRNRPLPVSPEEERAFGYIESWTPRRELASFIGQRAFVLQDHHRYREAVETFAAAADLDKGHATYPQCIVDSIALWKMHLRSQYPPRFPRRIDVRLRPGRRRWPSMPQEVEREIAVLHATEWCLHYPNHVRLWWGPLRDGRPPLQDVPTSMAVDYELVLQSPA